MTNVTKFVESECGSEWAGLRRPRSHADIDAAAAGVPALHASPAGAHLLPAGAPAATASHPGGVAPVTTMRDLLAARDVPAVLRALDACGSQRLPWRAPLAATPPARPREKSEVTALTPAPPETIFHAMNSRSASEKRVSSLRSRIREATAAAILAAAEDVFGQKGLTGAHMNEIAARAGVAVGTLYNHFRDRDALLAGLMNKRREDLLNILDRHLQNRAEGDFRTRLTNALEELFEFLSQHRRFHSIMVQGEMGGFLRHSSPMAAKRGPKLMFEVYQRFSELMQIGVDEGALKPDISRFYAPLFLSIIRGLFVHQYHTGSDSPAVTPAELVRFFFEGAGA